MRHFRRRSSGPRPVIQSFKKVLNFAPTSRAAGATISATLSDGEDSVAAGQTAVTDAGVPTGSIIKFIEVTFCATNLVNVSLFMHWTMQRVHSGQAAISPLVIGGNPQRNQCHRQGLFTIGQLQNSTHVIKFKVPKSFQRVRDGDSWVFSRNGSAVYTDALQVIYKFYR